MADVENPDPNDDGLMVKVAERSQFTRFTAMCMLHFLCLALLAISLLLFVLFDYISPGTKLAVVAPVAGSIGFVIVFTCTE
jgi:hypothetical protein